MDVRCFQMCPQEVLRALDRAFKNFFRRLKNGDEKVGFPKFKKKGIKDSFRLTGVIRFIGQTIQLPRLGRIRLKEKREIYHNGRGSTIGVFIPNWEQKDVAASWVETENACGEDVRPCKSLICEATSMNQEPNGIRRNVLFG